MIQKTVLGKLVVATCVVALLGVTGCGLSRFCGVKPKPAAPVEAPPKVVVKPVEVIPMGGPCPVRSLENGIRMAVYAIPTGERSSSIILLEKSGPEKVNVGQEFSYKIKVTNLTDCPLDSVVLTERLDPGLTFKSADPKAESVTGQIVRWDLGTIEGQKSREVLVWVSATEQGEFIHCANVTYIPRLCLTILAINPNIGLTQSAPRESLKCDPVPVTLVVKNTGTGDATNVKVTANLPDGVVTTDGQSSESFDVGTLTQGESKELTTTVNANKTGPFEVTSRATGDGNLSATASSTTVVRQPVLTIAKASSRRMVFLGQTFEFDITVANTGDWPAEQTVVTDELPEGAEFVSASDGGAEAAGVVTWQLGTLAPNQSKKVSMTVRAGKITNAQNTAKAEAVCAQAVTASAAIPMKGIPAILLEVIDVEDPIEVGDSVTYVIVATNQGSATGTNITITCALEASGQFVSAGGATEATQTGPIVKFAPLPELAAKAKAEWKVVVKAIKADDVRFRVTMTSDQIGRPVEETEATNFYE